MGKCDMFRLLGFSESGYWIWIEMIRKCSRTDDVNETHTITIWPLYKMTPTFLAGLASFSLAYRLICNFTPKFIFFHLKKENTDRTARA
jgi:hypothetical protein